MSATFHPETDGQIERLNAVTEHYLRLYFLHQNNCVLWLPMVEFAANNHFSSSINATQFFSNYGFHSRFTITLRPHAKSRVSLDAKDFALKVKELYKY